MIFSEYETLNDEDAYFSGHLFLSHLGLTCIPRLMPISSELVMLPDLNFQYPVIRNTST